MFCSAMQKRGRKTSRTKTDRPKKMFLLRIEMMIWQEGETNLPLPYILARKNKTNTQNLGIGSKPIKIRASAIIIVPAPRLAKFITSSCCRRQEAFWFFFFVVLILNRINTTGIRFSRFIMIFKRLRKASKVPLWAKKKERRIRTRAYES